MRSALGPTIKVFRKRKKLTQEALGVRLGVNRQTVGRWERGVFFPPDATIRELPIAFEVTVETFQEVLEHQLAVALRKRAPRVEPRAQGPGTEEAYPPIVGIPSEIAGVDLEGGRWISVYVPPKSLEDLRR